MKVQDYAGWLCVVEGGMNGYSIYRSPFPPMVGIVAIVMCHGKEDTH